MSRQRREQIVDIALKNNLFIIENGIFSDFATDPPAPIAALCPEQTAFVASLSYCASPEFRLGYLKTLSKNIPRLQATKRALAVSHSMIAAEIATHWVTSGILEELIRWQKKEIRSRVRITSEILGGLNFRYSPDGMFIWLYLPEPWRVTDFAAAAKERNIMVMESERFVIGRGAAPHAVRLSLTSAQTKELFVEGLKAIADLVESPSRINPLL
jgi:DNA-binding transcriptional MocR family regulator